MSTKPAILILIAGSLLAACDETVRSGYPDRAAAEADRLFERGWLPEIIPASSTGIVTVNDLDLNGSTGEFSFGVEDFDEFVRHLGGAPAAEQGNVSVHTYKLATEFSTSVWTFRIDRARGHCSYSMRLRR